MDIKISVPQGFSEIGQKSNQEDTLFPDLYEVSENQRSFIVCDGMGGHENGEVASNCVAETIGRITSSAPLCTTDEMCELFEKALEEMGIIYHRIRVATPRHNGKVERQHRTDEKRFYKKMRMYCLEDGREQLRKYNKR